MVLKSGSFVRTAKPQASNFVKALKRYKKAPISDPNTEIWFFLARIRASELRSRILKATFGRNNIRKQRKVSEKRPKKCEKLLKLY